MSGTYTVIVMNKLGYRLFCGLMAVVLAGCGGSSGGHSGSSVTPRYRIASTVPPNQIINFEAGIDNTGTVDLVGMEVDNLGNPLSVTAFINGSLVSLPLPPSGVQLGLILPGGTKGTSSWWPCQVAGEPGGSIVWDLSNPKAKPVQIAGFDVVAVRPDGEMAIGYDLKSRNVEYCDTQGHTSSFAIPNGVMEFAPSCINMKNQVAGLGFTSSGSACYLSDGLGGGTLLQGTQVKNSDPFAPNYQVESINSAGDSTGSSSTPGYAAGACWSPSGQLTVLKQTSSSTPPDPIYISDDDEIFGDGSQSFPTSNPALVWPSPGAAPLAIASLCTGRQVPDFIGVEAVSSNGRNLVVNDTSGNIYILERTN